MDLSRCSDRRVSLGSRAVMCLVRVDLDSRRPVAICLQVRVGGACLGNHLLAHRQLKRRQYSAQQVQVHQHSVASHSKASQSRVAVSVRHRPLYLGVARRPHRAPVYSGRRQQRHRLSALHQSSVPSQHSGRLHLSEALHRTQPQAHLVHSREAARNRTCRKQVLALQAHSTSPKALEARPRLVHLGLKQRLEGSLLSVPLHQIKCLDHPGRVMHLDHQRSSHLRSRT